MSGVVRDLKWPGQARLAVCVVLDCRPLPASEEGCALVDKFSVEQLSQRTLALLAELECPLTVLVDQGSAHIQDSELVHKIKCTRNFTDRQQLAVVLSSSQVPAYELRSAQLATPICKTDGATRSLCLPLLTDCSDRQLLPPIHWTPDEWLQYVIDSFDCLHAEAREQALIFGLHLHAQAIGRPGSIAVLRHLLSYFDEREWVWMASAEEISRHVGKTSEILR